MKFPIRRPAYNGVTPLNQIGRGDVVGDGEAPSAIDGGSGAIRIQVVMRVPVLLSYLKAIQSWAHTSYRTLLRLPALIAWTMMRLLACIRPRMEGTPNMEGLQFDSTLHLGYSIHSTGDRNCNASGAIQHFSLRSQCQH